MLTDPHSLDRRQLLRAGLIAGGLGLTASCARGADSQAAPSGQVSLFNDNPTWKPGYAAAGSQLAKLTGYTLAPRAVPNTTNYQQIIRMSGRTNSGSDLVKWWNGYRLQDVARDGVFADMSSAWKTAIANGWIDDPVLQKTCSYQGRQYAIPMYKSYYVVFYSKAAFAKMKAEPPSTWDDFHRLIDKANKAGITPLAGPGATTWESLIWFEQLVNGVSTKAYEDLTAGKASYTDAPVKEAMAQWVDLYRRKAFSAPDLAAVDVPAMLKKGSVAMFLYGSWDTGGMLAAGNTDKTFGAFILPTASGRPAVGIESGVFTISAKAHKKKAALDVAAHWLAPSVQRAWINFLDDSSANAKVVPKVRAIRDVVAQVQKQRPVQFLRYWEASPPVLIQDNVSSLSAFLTSPSAAAASHTLSAMQHRADTEWEVWKKS